MFNIFTFEKSVGAVIFSEDEKGFREYLLLHYPSGHWDFPKGHVEAGESDEMTLRREVKEETGIADLEIVPKFKTNIRYFYRAKGDEREKRTNSGKSINIIKEVVFYTAKTKTKEVQLSFEHKNFQWLNFAEAYEKVTFKNGKNVLEKAHNFLNK